MKTPFSAWLRKLFQTNDGATAVEYALMLALIAAVALASILMLGGESAQFWDANSNDVETAFDSAFDR